MVWPLPYGVGAAASGGWAAMSRSGVPGCPGIGFWGGPVNIDRFWNGSVLVPRADGAKVPCPAVTFTTAADATAGSGKQTYLAILVDRRIVVATVTSRTAQYLAPAELPANLRAFFFHLGERIDAHLTSW